MPTKEAIGYPEEIALLSSPEVEVEIEIVKEAEMTPATSTEETRQQTTPTRFTLETSTFQ
jgi:hypothetical protein